MPRRATLFPALLVPILLAWWAPPTRAQETEEAGGFEVLSKSGGAVQTQDMGPFPLGKWQNNDQLWWTGAKPGDKLTIAIPIRQTGTYAVSAVLTKARDYGIVQLSLDGKKVGGPLDLYNPEVISTEPLPLGTHTLTAGKHQLTVEIVGANPKAQKSYLFGLDYLSFQPAGKDGPPAFVVPTPLYPYESLSPEAAAKAMRLPPGFSVRLGAGEPDIKQPIAMALDDRGRLWVAEAYAYPRRAPEGQGHDRILIFEDTDGDGHFDKRTVFIDNLNLVSGLEVGFGGVWVGAAPYLMYIPIKAGTDRPAGPPKILLDGWGMEDTHETLNTFTWGPDGWLYGCHGVFTHSRVGEPGTPANKRVKINAGIWRYHPTRHVFEVFAEGTSNPWGIDFNDVGDAFCTACVIPHLFHVIPGARYERQAGQHFNPYTYGDIRTIADHLHYIGNQWNNNDRRRSDELGGGHAHAGAMIYQGGSWPEQYRTAIFMNNIHGNRINMDWLRPEGSGYVGTHGKDFILTDDQSSQILNLRYGPDGQVWMIDWYDRSQCHVNDPKVPDRSNGRIFQVRYQNAKPVHVDLQKETDAALVKMQLNHNDWFVRHARKVLQERAAAGKLKSRTHPALAKIALTHPDETRRLRGLWTLFVTGGLTEEIAHKALAGNGPHERAWAARLLVENGKKPSAATLARFAELAHTDPSPVVRLALAATLQRIPLAERWTILEALTSHREDASDHNLPFMYWYAAEPLAGVDARRALTFGMVAGQNIPLLRDFMVRRIGSSTTAKALDLLIEGLGEAKTPAEQLAFLRGTNQALVGVRKIEPPARWRDVAAKLQDSKDPEIVMQTLTLGVTFGDGAAIKHLGEVAEDSRTAVPARKQALAALLHAHVPHLAPVLQQLVADPALRAEALRGLAAYDDPKTPGLLLRTYPKLPPAEKRDALATLCSRVSYAGALVTALEKKRLPATELSADLVRQLRNLKDSRLTERLNQVWGSVRESSADKAKLIARFKALLTSPPRQPPDPTLGRAMFAKTCQQCHTLYGVGGKVGPDITGSNRTDLDYLLSNVLDPSAVIPKEYQQTVLVTSSGRVITGIIKGTNANALTLQTPEEVVVVPRGEVEETRKSDQSMMPDGLLDPLSEHEVRSLAAYLMGRQQVPMRATAENVAGFYSGKDLAGWQGDPEVWSFQNGAIVCRGKGGDTFLVSDLQVEDFDLTLEVKTAGEVKGAILFRAGRMPGGQPHGNDDAKIGGHPGAWQKVEIIARGGRTVVKKDGVVVVDRTDRTAPHAGVIALVVSARPGAEVRFRNLQLRLPSAKAGERQASAP
jgi:putative membrane-bound dehydrogenase-like protein